MNVNHVVGLDSPGLVTLSGVQREHVKVRIREGWLEIHVGECKICLHPKVGTSTTPLELATTLAWESGTAVNAESMCDEIPSAGEPLPEIGGIVPSGDFKPRFDITQDPDGHDDDVSPLRKVPEFCPVTAECDKCPMLGTCAVLVKKL
jgi:hypothetical protein